MAQSEICLALNNSEFHELFENADSLNHNHFIDNEKHKTKLGTFFLGHPVYKEKIFKLRCHHPCQPMAQ